MKITIVCLPGLGDLWATSEQVLEMMAGGEVEHGVLLTCYLLGLGRNAYLLLGRGVPEGRTAYTLTVDQSGQVGRCHRIRIKAEGKSNCCRCFLGENGHPL